MSRRTIRRQRVASPESMIPPFPPGEANYTIPGGATAVSTMDQLATELNGGTAKDIKVLNGTYNRPAPISDMVAPTLSQSATGGSLSDGTYTYLVTAINAQGETMGATQSIVLNGGTATQKVTISWGAHASGTVTGYRVYGRSGVSTALRRLPTQPSGLALTLDDTGATITSTTAPPTRNSTGGYIRPGAGHRIWCESVDGVIADFGFMIANITGFEVHGGTWDISDATKLGDDGAGRTGFIVQFVSSTNTDRNLKVTDVKIDLHQLGRYGVYGGQPGGLVAQRIFGDRCTDAVVCAFNNGPATSAGWVLSNIAINVISDIRAERIFRMARGSANGEDEYGVTVGHPVTNGVSRVYVRDAGWAGLLVLGKCANTVFEYIDADVCWGYIPSGTAIPSDVGKITGQGIYIERTTRNCTFRHLRLGASGDIQRGIAMEWDENQNYRLTSPYTIGDSVMNVDYGRFDAQVPTSGTIYIGETEQIPITYTGWNAGAKQFTGCSGGSGGPYPTGTFVSTWPGGRHAATDVTVEDFYIDASTLRQPARPRRGITCDQGTMRPIIRRGIIKGCDTWAILDSSNVPHAVDPSGSNMTIENVQFELNPGAIEVGRPAS